MEPVPKVVGYFKFCCAGGVETTSMAMAHELRIATASKDSIPAATKVSPRWEAWKNKTPPITWSPYTANGTTA
jgi:hypothetical protein